MAERQMPIFTKSPPELVERFAGVPGKPMKACVPIPRPDVADDRAIRRWVERGLAPAASVPPKT